MIRTYPDNTFQYFCDPWWERDEGKSYCRGRLVQVFIPHVGQTPYQLIPQGRAEATIHDKALCQIAPLRAHQKKPSTKLPMAGIPVYSGEVLTVYRAKLRPALIIAKEGKEVDKVLRQDKPKWQTSPTILVAPYYGADEGGKRAGFKSEFRSRVCTGEYPQFVWDSLPIGPSTEESILRLDHIQPVGDHHESINLTPFKLTPEALDIIDEWIRWLIWGVWKEGSSFDFLRAELMAISKDE
ncbi:MAG: hypothetical protein JEZ02_07890 [Desulfatibacillum sp.]|nr:hypothetical protein [Desulfatibacillum sp.]